MAENKDDNLAFSTFFAIKIFLTLISSLIIYLFIYFQMQNGNIIDNDEQRRVLLIVFIQVFLSSLNSIYELSFRAKMNVAKIEMTILFGTTCGALFSIISIFVFHNFYLYLIGNIINESIRMVLFILLGRQFKFTKIKKILLKRYISLSIFLVIPVVLNVLKTNLGPFFFLKHYDYELLGIYSVFSMLFLIIKSLQLTLRFLLVPNFINLIQENKMDELKTSINQFEKYMTIINASIIIGGLIFGEFAIKRFLGNIYYDQGIRLFQGFLFSMMMYPLMSGYISLLVSHEHFKVYAISETINIVFSIISWLIFIPLVNIIGIELGLWIAIIPNSIYVRKVCQKYLGVGKISRGYTTHLIFITILFILSYYIGEFHLDFIRSSIVLALLLGTYALFLIKMKIFTKSDYLYIRDTINPRKMVDYIKSETINEEKNER